MSSMNILPSKKPLTKNQQNYALRRTSAIAEKIIREKEVPLSAKQESAAIKAKAKLISFADKESLVADALKRCRKISEVTKVRVSTYSSTIDEVSLEIKVKFTDGEKVLSELDSASKDYREGSEQIREEVNRELRKVQDTIMLGDCEEVLEAIRDFESSLNVKV